MLDSDPRGPSSSGGTSGSAGSLEKLEKARFAAGAADSAEGGRNVVVQHRFESRQFVFVHLPTLHLVFDALIVSVKLREFAPGCLVLGSAFKSGFVGSNCFSKLASDKLVVAFLLHCLKGVLVFEIGLLLHF